MTRIAAVLPCHSLPPYPALFSLYQYPSLISDFFHLFMIFVLLSPQKNVSSGLNQTVRHWLTEEPLKKHLLNQCQMICRNMQVNMLDTF